MVRSLVKDGRSRVNSILFLEKTLTMKLTLLSKTLGTLGLIAVLATMVSTAIPKNAQAQSNVEVPAEIDDEACLAAGMNSFYVLQEIDFSPAQLEEIYRISSEKDNAYEQLTESYPRAEDLASGPQFDARSDTEMTSEMYTAMDAARTTISATTDSVTEQIAALNEQFGQYGEYGIGQIVNLTSEQKAEIKRTAEDFEAQYITVMTPEQQQQYRENLETESRINDACGITKDPIIIDSISFGFDSPNF
jgi:hypothetical protein